ncbi:hypothetical protein ACHHYP_06129 [Achlya hypogyna]|uniref:NAD(P)-binding domain-containing protein n=1 Tax=Achlya hypogyna TaxID=1202772 RepID=A0A1V9YV42_ACHHY|nr:hypothetical protein ACHHYP_06129 [Achlya hypogyna]
MLPAGKKAIAKRVVHSTMVYNPRQHLLLVVGGNGFVGSNILQRAVAKGIEVRSLNRSGKPEWGDQVPWVDKVDWVQGDVFSKADLAKAIDGVTGVISTVGAFGSNEFMQKMCGDANIEVARAAKECGVDRFVFVSESRVGSDIPTWAPLYGYFDGKARAEAAVTAHFPETGVCLRPGMIYGTRRVGNYLLPLQLIGAPLRFFGRDCGPVSSVLTRVPLVGGELLAAAPVGAVAKVSVLIACALAITSIRQAAVLGALGPAPGKILDTSSILAFSESFHTMT